MTGEQEAASMVEKSALVAGARVKVAAEVERLVAVALVVGQGVATVEEAVLEAVMAAPQVVAAAAAEVLEVAQMVEATRAMLAAVSCIQPGTRQ